MTNNKRKEEEKRYADWEWIEGNDYRCTHCWSRETVRESMNKPDWPWCPNCGAEMRGVENRWTD